MLLNKFELNLQIQIFNIMVEIIDGGNSTHARELGHRLCPHTWSAEIVLNNPSLVKQIHENYIKSGSNYITTFNYSCTPYYQSKKNFDYKKGIKIAGELAREVSTQYSHKNIKVLGCIPPYSESYRVDLIPENPEFNNFYRDCIQLLDKNIDIYLLETMSSYQEALKIITLIKEISGKPIWISFSTNKGNLLRCGHQISQLAKSLSKLGIEALLFNCIPISIIDEILSNLDTSNTNIKIGLYPNLHDHTIDDDFCLETSESNKSVVYKSLTPDEYMNYFKNWVHNNGVSIIGGCCGIGPEYIDKLNSLKYS